MITPYDEEVSRRADDLLRSRLPAGVKLLRTLRGHTGYIGRIAWSPDGKLLATPSADKTVRLWNAGTSDCLHTLTGHEAMVTSVAFDPTASIFASAGDDRIINLWDSTSGRLSRTLEGRTIYPVEGHSGAIKSVAFYPPGRILASASGDKTIKLWEASSGKMVSTLEGHRLAVHTVAFDPSGRLLASGGVDRAIKLWEPGSGKLVRTLDGHGEAVNGVAFAPGGNQLVSVSLDKTVRIWAVPAGRLQRTLEGHTGEITGVAFSADGRLLATRGGEGDGSLRIWRTDTWECAVIIPGGDSSHWLPGLAFHPRLPLLAVVGSDVGTRKDDRDQVVHILELNPAALLGKPTTESSVHYVNAKVVLVGDTGVGKSGLTLVLTHQEFEATESTPGRRVWTFDFQEVAVGGNAKQTRETLLWDLAGQPGYRVIHQLHLNEAAVALVVFDARSETDPLAGVRHWERALRLAQQRQGTSGVPLRKFLVSARNDRGGVSISEERLQAILTEFGFDAYFKTSAKEGWQIKELRAAIEDAIEWEELPEVLSSQLFADIKSFLLDVKKTGRLLAPTAQLYGDFVNLNAGRAAKVSNLREQFLTCIGRLENRDLIRRLSFGDYVLLQPELLDAYASAMINTAKDEPDGLGSLAEEVALAGKFYVPKEQKVTDPGQEQLLLHATVEELVRHELALRENADDGRYLVFPSQFNRDYEDAPEPKGKAVAITFDGPVQSLYSTLAVRLGHSGLFTTGRTEMWRNAAIFDANAGGRCGLFLQEFAEGRGRLIIFYEEQASPETRFHFEEYVIAHTKRRALDNSIEIVRYFVCHECGEPVPDAYVKTLRNKGQRMFNCPCGGSVELAEPKERLHFRSAVAAMDKSADRERGLNGFVISAIGETSTASFQQWAGGQRVTMAIVFTDIVGSTALGEEIRDQAMNEVRQAHFAQSRKLITEYRGREIKTIGDSFMAAFRSADAALDYAMALQRNTGHPMVQIRAGIHIGPMDVEESDVFGGTVNFGARVVGAVKDAEVWMSDRAKQDIDSLGSERHRNLKWNQHANVPMQGFRDVFTLWSLGR